ncbi:hypothetical protein C530_221 [Candidatus Portiera aleyrodidarum BT-B-HRs]|nr:hypothetical protein C548_220 [Candidatus Portiera aleyrodidarum BT-QVLC]AFT80863.1 hypothetical protein C530_221 [Candidatus Portiera aleyrodidarum BT-B-HRs]
MGCSFEFMSCCLLKKKGCITISKFCIKIKSKCLAYAII